MKTILITGGNGGLGRAIKYELSSDYKILSYSRSSQEYPFDLSQTELYEEDYIMPCDVAIMNAGIWTHDDKPEIIKRNLTGTMWLSDVIVGRWIKNKQKGHIIFIASNSAYEGFAGNEWYSASKAGLLGYSRCLYKTCYPHGINVSVISPGTCNTDFWYRAKTDNRKKCQPIEPIEIAKIIKLVLELKSCVKELIIMPKEPKE